MSSIYLHRFLAGDDSAAVIAWLQSGFALYVREDGAIPLTQCLRLPSTPARAARLARDAFIAEAARLLPGTDWGRAKELEKIVKGEKIATGEFALALRFARETGAPLPRTARRLHQIIVEASEIKSEEDFTMLM